ncbi:hypothetical protein [Lacinutrix salivirga]
MKKVSYLLGILCVLITACDDGDVITASLEFDQELALCGDINSANYVLYDTKTSPNESLTLLFPVNSANNAIFNPTSNDLVTTLTINANTTRFNYRTYSGDPLLLICQELPDAGVSIINDYEAASGASALLTTTFIDDDGDGIPSADENQDPNGDGNFDDAQDTDSDGIPDYLDKDDDNDSILTINEDLEDDDDNPFTNPLDTDNDETPNYLDNDDDGDGVETIFEDGNGNGIILSSDLGDIDPNSITNPEVVRYLDENSMEVFEAVELAENTYTRTITVDVKIINADISILNADEIDFGTYTTTIIFTE